MSHKDRKVLPLTVPDAMDKILIEMNLKIPELTDYYNNSTKEVQEDFFESVGDHMIYHNERTRSKE